MTSDQLATRLAAIDSELRRNPSPEFKAELHEAFRKTDLAFRAARQAELDAMDCDEADAA